MNLGEGPNQNVKVYIRPRPFTEFELQTRQPNAIHHMTSKEIVMKQKLNEKKYLFEEVFRQEASQAEVYQVVVSPLIDYTVSGYNCTVFAYGQTGTGKTHTMTGDLSAAINLSHDPNSGMIPRAAAHLFQQLNKLDPNKIEYSVKVSYIEIYNEEVRDLLSNDGVPLKVYEDPDNKGSVCMKGLKEETVCSSTEVIEWLAIGNQARISAATNLNIQSSRSHTLFSLLVHTRETTVRGEELIKFGKLHLVDLAGSENIGRSGATNVRAREAGTINKSLLTLGKVIKALAHKMQYIPYRDSKLTRILQDSLGGKTKTCMIATINPCMSAWDETLSTLDYANEARCVANCPQVNVSCKRANILKDFKEEIHRLRSELAAARTGEGFYISQENYEQITQDLKVKSDRILYLIQEASKLEEDKAKLNEAFAKTREYLERTKEELKQKENEMRKKQILIQYLDKRDTKISTTAQQLLEVCKTFTYHEQILHNKYQKQCDLTLENASVAKHLAALIKNTLRSLEANNKTIRQRFSRYDKIKAADLRLIDVENKNLLLINSEKDQIEMLKLRKLDYNIAVSNDNNLYEDDKVINYFNFIFKHMEEEKIAFIKTAIQYIQDFHNETQLDENAKLVLFKEAFNIATSTEDGFRLKKGEIYDKAKEQCNYARSEINGMAKTLEQMSVLAEQFSALVVNAKNNIKSISSSNQEFNVLCDDMNSLENQHKNANLINKLEDHLSNHLKHRDETCYKMASEVTQLKTKIQEFDNYVIDQHHKSAEYLTGLRRTLDENLERFNQRNECDFHALSKCNEDININISKSLADVENISDEVSQLCYLDKTQVSDVKMCIQQTLTSLHATENNIKDEAHNGDTPAKQTYELPTKIKKRVPQQILFEKFLENKENTSLNMNEVHENSFDSDSSLNNSLNLN